MNTVATLIHIQVVSGAKGNTPALPKDRSSREYL